MSTDLERARELLDATAGRVGGTIAKDLVPLNVAVAAIVAAYAEEREACAKVARGTYVQNGEVLSRYQLGRADAMDAIRARGGET